MRFRIRTHHKVHKHLYKRRSRRNRKGIFDNLKSAAGKAVNAAKD
jgi:hypothetical protein